MEDLRHVREGELTLSGCTWRWAVRRAPSGENDAQPVDFLEWFEFTFRRVDDPEQEAHSRAGLPRQEWTERTLRSILRSVRERTWRDDEGTLWRLRLSGWSTAGVSTDVGRGSSDEGPDVLFQPVGGGDTLERPAGDLRSLTDVPDDQLQAVLNGERNEAGP